LRDFPPTFSGHTQKTGSGQFSLAPACSSHYSLTVVNSKFGNAGSFPLGGCFAHSQRNQA
jgi:hypothetical protein